MLGAIIGDIVGSRYEFNPTNDYNFELFGEGCAFTDDTICTIAVADAILRGRDYGESIHEWCRKYPNPKGGYGGRFRQWVMSNNPQPYGSFGNGSAMRVSPVAWVYDNEEAVLYEAALTASCTHNHPEGIKGAQTTALAVFNAIQQRKQNQQPQLDTIIERCVAFSCYNCNLNRKNVMNRFDETCQGTVPVAFWIMGTSVGFEDAIRKAISLGADADTLGAIVGSIAEPVWKIPTWIRKKAMRYIPDEMNEVVNEFEKRYGKFEI